MDGQLATLANSLADLLLCDGVCIVLQCANPELRHPLLTLYLQKTADTIPYYGTLAYPEILLGERFRALCDIAMYSGSAHMLFNATEIGSSLSGVVFVCPMSMMVAPLELAEGVLGFVLCTDMQKDAFSDGELYLLQYQLSSLAFKVENFLYKHLFESGPVDSASITNRAASDDAVDTIDTIDLADLCQNLLQNVQKQWRHVALHEETGQLHEQKRSFTIYCAFDTSVPLSRDHSDSVRLILLHLLENALLYSPQGGLIEVLIHRRRPLRAVSLLPFAAPADPIIPALSPLYVTVRDHGIGIKPPYQSLVVKPFTRLYHPLTARITGRGLGLYIAQQLAEKMHGHLHMRSHVNHGTSVTLVLPIPLLA